jgi:hypothetical protein
MSEQQAPPSNPFAGPSVAVALFALFLGAFVRLGAAVGLLAVVIAGFGLVRAEKSDRGLAASLFGLALGVLAVLWTAVTVVN